MPNVSKRNQARRRRRTLAALAFTSCLTLGFALAPNEAQAKPMRSERRVGLGGGVGDPFGPSLKLFLHPQHALQFDLGWAPLHHGDGIFHVNYLFHIPPFVSNSVMDFGMYLGGGLGVAFWAPHHRACYYDDRPGPDRRYCGYWRGHHRGYGGGAAMIVRIPVGLFFHWQTVPIDTVVEGGWSPYVVYWDPFHGDFSIKIRYYF